MQEPEKMEVICPECRANCQALWFPPNRIKTEVPGTRAGKTVRWSGRGEKVDGKCSECGYKFKLDDLE